MMPDKLAPRGGRPFDFGAGPRLDARFFGERGLGVGAYDYELSGRFYTFTAPNGKVLAMPRVAWTRRAAACGRGSA